MTAAPEILQRLDRALAELQALRAAVAGERAAGELTEAERREIDELVARRAARMRRSVRP